ncbi:energy transducer TonB [Gilvimarinus sp. SDUM040013]|uniref:Energy transducer TonB n=1 Tax=Gilvimarinus gilvus TaxID=3058038 RepID=A0ABU4S2I2_9GAMM|nr:energy transducer TonB [Gilvimarinus sp. SDUM040013]MDO3386314.1 energy transducer TonB [Gilvimarinus sp. SDUM040013]MDX6850028.1 energy transducer TonB [Gilvimarinus sp. SDUM040013]
MDTSLTFAIIDSTFKVAAGAGIAFASAWWWSRQNHVIGPRSLREQKRLDIFEEISGFVGDVTHIFSKYASLAAESVEFGERWPATRKAELEKVNEELVATFQKMAAAEAKLLILGEKNLEKSLKIYAGQIVGYRRQVYAGRKDITPEQAAALRQGVLQARESFYDMLSRKYDKVLSGAI